MERTVTRSVLALLFLVLCTGPTTVLAQPSPSTPRFTVSTHGPVTVLDRRVHELLEEQLAAQDFPELLESWVLLFDVEEIEREGAQDIALSVVAMSGLPEEVIALGAEQEVFYLAFAKGQELPEEGKQVRQYMSEDWLRQYYSIRGQYMRVVPASQLEQACALLIEAFSQEPWF